MVQRDERSYMPPMKDFVLKSGDVLVVNTTRKALLAAAEDDPSALHPVHDDAGEEEAGRALECWQSNADRSHGDADIVTVGPDARGNTFPRRVSLCRVGY
jgi:hypothetical protein